jgi:outer membrane protein OmpA-like peptidoglycan-associated protein
VQSRNLKCAFALVLCAIAAASARAEPARIPLQKGLVLSYSGFASEIPQQQTAGEMERVVEFLDRTAELLTLQIQFTDYAGDPKLRRQVLITRTVREKDMQSAHKVLFRFLADDPSNLPGLTLLHASKALLHDLVADGHADFVFGNGPIGASGWFSALSRKYYRGVLNVVEPTVPIEILANGEKIAIPTIHVHGVLEVGDLTSDVEFWFSTDSDNPLIVRSQAKEGNWIQLVRADFPVAPAPEPPKESGEKPLAPAPTIVEAQLAGPQCRTTLHGVYFDTGSVALLPASTPALQQVAGMLKQHGDWSITIEGHTDNIGGEAYNLDLSNRRAQAVSDALSGQYGIAPAQLKTSGFGQTRPVDSNETIVGRAHNRRVELARKC